MTNAIYMRSKISSLISESILNSDFQNFVRWAKNELASFTSEKFILYKPVLRIRILYSQKDPMLFKCSRYKIV